MVSAFKTMSSKETSLGIAGLSRERAHLAGERAHLENKLSLVSGLAVRLEALIAASGKAESGVTAQSTQGAPGHEASSAAGDLSSSSTPLLSEKEKTELEVLRAEMPRLSDQTLLYTDVDSVLADRNWNPKGRELSAEERDELSRLLDRYKYFARLAPVESFKAVVEPEVARMREIGAFVEYANDEAVPVVPGVKISHAEASDKEGYRRLYYFFADDYPELYHRQVVEHERQVECFVRAYYVINDPDRLPDG